MYSYEKEKPNLFTEEGFAMLIAIRDHARALLAKSGAATTSKIIEGARSGSSWTMLACVDYLVERGELRLVSGQGMRQDWIYVAGRSEG